MIGAAVAVNEVDAKRWFGQLLPELERFGVGVAWILDHCSRETIKTVEDFSGTVGITLKEGKSEFFVEKWRRHGCDQLRDKGFKWVILWDSDDTFHPNAPEAIRKALKNEMRSAGYVRRANIYQKDGELFIRHDGPFQDGGSQTNRTIIYNLEYALVWMDNVTHGPYTFKIGSSQHESETFQVEAHSIHWGLMDEQLRKDHKVRWDENYTKAIGRNPYGLWNYTLEDHELILEPYEDWLKRTDA